MAQMMLMVVLLLVSSHVAVFADQTNTKNDLPTCQSSTENQDFDKVSLLTVKTQLKRGKEQDGASIDSKQVRASAADTAVDVGSCGTAKCNPAICAGTIDYGINEGKRKATGPYCFKSFGVHECCREDYESGTYFRQSVNQAEDPCAGCTSLEEIAPDPVTVYVMRHGEGCHNLDVSFRKMHPHKTFGQYDAPLSTNGVAQAAAAQPSIDAIRDIDEFLVSPLRRAQQTIEIAKAGTRYDAQKVSVVPYANERGRGKTNENKPTSPTFQRCLMDQDTAVNTLTSVRYMERCVDYDLGAIVHNHPGGFHQLSTCEEVSDENGKYKIYAPATKATAPQEFADFLTLAYPRKVVFLTGHSNWAKDAGVMQDDRKNKINWAGIYKLILIPGQDVKVAGEAAQEVYFGTPKGATPGASTQVLVHDEARCQADLTSYETCETMVDARPLGL